jgi:hypothetical protein
MQCDSANQLPIELVKAQFGITQVMFPKEDDGSIVEILPSHKCIPTDQSEKPCFHGADNRIQASHWSDIVSRERGPNFRGGKGIPRGRENVYDCRDIFPWHFCLL